MTDNSADVGRTIRTLFPEIEAITDPTITAGVIDVWRMAIEDNPGTDIETMPWGVYHDDITGETQLDHIRQVTQHAVSIAETMLEHRPDLELDMDVLLASALLHDVSKMYEMAPGGTEFSDIGELLPHPAMAIYLLHRHGLPVSVMHNVFAHTHQTGLEPVTIEGQIVKVADIITLEALSWEHRRRPHNTITTAHYFEEQESESD